MPLEFAPHTQPGHALRHFVSRPEGAHAFFLAAAAESRAYAKRHPQARRGALQFARMWAEAARAYRTGEAAQ